MIDWITAHLVIPHNVIPGGRILMIDPAGEIEWQTVKHLPVEGSYESRVQVKTIETSKGQAIRIHGNPLKFLQGHNLFGSDDWMGLLGGMYERVSHFAPSLGLPPMPGPPGFDIDLKRIDVTYMFELGSSKDVDAYIHAVAKTSRSRAQSGMFEGETLYFQKRSRRWSMKLYNKAREIKRHPMSKLVPLQAELESWAEGKLRQEITLRGKELDQVSDDLLGNVRALFETYKRRITMADNVKVSDGKIRELKPHLRGYYHAWLHGEDLKPPHLPNNTFYRVRRQLLAALNVDISIPCAHPEKSNVVRFVRTLEPKPVFDIPDFAQGTGLYFDPDVEVRQLKLV